MKAEMTDEAKAALEKANAEATDWWGKCRKCGKIRYGTLTQLKEPCTCEVSNGNTI